MKLYCGERLVAKVMSAQAIKNVVHQHEKLLLLSDRKCTEISLGRKNKLIVWGRIYAVVQHDGKYANIGEGSTNLSAIEMLYRELGINDFIQRIEGDFVACLIAENKEAIVFSDSFNRKDIFYSFCDDGVIISSNLAPMVSEINKKYDQAALANILSIYGMYAPKKHTIFENIRRLGVGEYLVCGEKIVVHKNPFSPMSTRDFGPTENEEYANLLDESIAVRESSGCNWLYLSSGWDSTALLAILVNRLGSSKVKAVTGRMKYSERAGVANAYEIARAKKFADYYGIDARIVDFDYTTVDSIKYWDTIRPHLRDNHIYCDNSCNMHLLSKYIQESSESDTDDIVYCGEISDGAHNFGFAQFATILEHPSLEFREYSDKMASYLFGPTFFKSVLNKSYQKDAVYQLLRGRSDGHLFDDVSQLGTQELKTKFIESFFLRNRRLPFYSIRNQVNLTKDGMERYQSEMFDGYLKECVENLDAGSLYSWILYLYNSFHWQGSTIKSISETASYNGLHLTMPFWDKHLQTFLSKMPENWGRGLELRPTKYPLKCMLENKFDYPFHLHTGPHSYLYDTNPGFSLEVELLYGSAWKAEFQKMMKDCPFDEILSKEYFNIDYYHDLARNYALDQVLSGQQLSDVYNLIWLCWIGWY